MTKYCVILFTRTVYFVCALIAPRNRSIFSVSWEWKLYEYVLITIIIDVLV